MQSGSSEASEWSTTPNPSNSRMPNRAACSYCKLRKIKCSISNDNETRCDSCIKRQIECRPNTISATRNIRVPLPSPIRRRFSAPTLPRIKTPLRVESSQLNSIHSRLNLLDDRIGINTLFDARDGIDPLELSVILSRLNILETYVGLNVGQNGVPLQAPEENIISNSSLANWDGKLSRSRRG